MKLNEKISVNKNKFVAAGIALSATATVIGLILLCVFIASGNGSGVTAALVITVIAAVAVTAQLILYYFLFRKLIDDAEEKRRQAEKTKNDVLSRLSREVRTPMTTIAGMTKLALKNHKEEDKTRDCLEKISLSSKRIVELINSMPDVEEAEKILPDGGEEAEEFDLTGRKIILAEDNELSREIEAKLLEEAGLTVVTAENGQLCLDELLAKKAGTYDAILMDVNMPVMNGYETTRIIRTLKRGYNNIPVIAMTADAFSEDVKKCLDCGMNAHVAKPMDVEKVKAALAKCLKK